MKKIIIVSDDSCAVKQILNNIKKINQSTNTKIYSTKEFKNKVIYHDNDILEKDIIYLIDIYNMQDDYLEVLKKIREQDWDSKIIIICMNRCIEIIFKSRLCIYNCIEKWNDFDNKIKNTLSGLLKNKEEPSPKNNIQISNSKIPIVIHKDEIESIYRLSNNQISIHYKNGNNSILISIDKTTPQLKEITQNNFYLDKSNFKVSSRNYYSEPLKQLVVDLYLIFKIDCNTLSKHFRIDKKYIKKWATLSKYNRKLNIVEVIIGKLIIKSYFKN